MNSPYRNVLVIADIEGSSGCTDYEASSFKTESWARACLDMTLDVKAVTSALLDRGCRNVTVKDFHRTGYNIFPEMIDKRVRLIPGYRRGPVPGLGDPGQEGALIMIGMHAPSGSDGFLAHTLTSRIARLTVNGKLLSEAELFSSSLHPSGLSPVFFSGCPVACRYAKDAVSRIETYEIDNKESWTEEEKLSWRNGLAEAAVRSLDGSSSLPFRMGGPFEGEMTMRDGSQAAAKLAHRWGLDCSGDTIHFRAGDFDSFYYTLIRICYLTPLLEKILPLGLPLYNLYGRMGLNWARRRIGL